MYKLIIKRVIDITSSLFGIILFSPLIIAITILLFFLNNRKPFFVQRRPGKNGKIFKIIKFKTMNDKKDDNGILLPDYKRITKAGYFIRNNSLDEIPQLFNVFVGQMSLVGPRPLLEEYLPLYTKEQAKRHNVRPGITGWAQVNGRNTITWEQKFVHDIWYVQNISFETDFKIIIRTIEKVVKKKDISANEEVTMELFTGTKID